VLYKFKSKAAGDLIMLGPNGDALLHVLGRTPAAKGIIEVKDMAATIATIERAVAEDEAQRQAARRHPGGRDSADADAVDPARTVSLRQRLWPMVEMLRRAQSAAEPIVWGV
jgi:hypothetical protein